VAVWPFVEQSVAYLAHGIALPDLVDLAESAMMDGEFEAEDPKQLKQIVGRLGAADERELQPAWEELDQIVDGLGYELRTSPMLIEK